MRHYALNILAVMALLSTLLVTRSGFAQLTAPPLLPIPCQCSGTPPNLTDCQPRWNGTIPELYFADAMAQCSATATGGYDDFEVSDLYATAIVNMENEVGTADNIPGAIWSSLRQNPSLTCEQQTLVPNQVVPWPSYVVPENIVYTSTDSQQYWANNDLRVAGVNLCIAQVLRTMVSGASSGEALVFSDADQRELLEIVRERAQIAMLYYALLGEAFAQPQYTGVATPDLQARLPLLNNWAWGSSASTLTTMGNDFAAAVQLHAYVTQEMASLLARSRSARLPRTPQPLAPADDLWGYNSWFQREMALLFGGDPLVINSSNTGGAAAAWNSPLATPYPGTLLGIDWPSFQQGPYEQTALTTPVVSELLGLAQQFDDVTLQTVSGAPGCATAFVQSAFDATATANWIYENVEFDLEVANCSPLVNNACPPPTPRSLRTVPTDGTVDDTWLLWSLYQIAPSDALTLANYLIDAVSDPTCPESTVSYSGAFAIGGVDRTGGSTIAIVGTGVHISPQAILSPRTLAQLGPTYGLNSILRFADATEMNFYEPGADVGSFGFDGGCIVSSGACVQGNASGQGKQESMRTMGAMAALGATREMLLDTEHFLGSSPPAGANTGILGTYLKNADSMIGVLEGAVGPSVSMRSGVYGVNLTDGTVTMQPEAIGTNGDPSVVTQYRVRLTVESSDSFWSGFESNPSAYTLYFLTSSYASDLAVHPEAEINGETIAAAIQAATTASENSYQTNDLSSGITLSDGLLHIEFVINIPSSGRGTLVVAASPTSAATSYRLVAANVAVPTTTSVPNGTAGSTAPPASFFGEYFAMGGYLGTEIQHQAEPSSSNPTEPAYDGFDLPNHWVPPFNAALLGGDASQPSASTYLSLAQTAATTATTAVQTALQDLQQQAQDQATAQAAAVQAAASVQQDAAALCGQGNANCDLQIDTVALNNTWYPQAPAVPSCTGLSGNDLSACDVTVTLVQFVQEIIATLSNPNGVESLTEPNPLYLVADAVLQTRVSPFTRGVEAADRRSIS